MLICGRSFSRLHLIAAVAVVALAASAHAHTPDSGIYGTMVAAWGNAPANPPSYNCVRVFDPSGQRLLATGVCSGLYGAFRIPLAPGRYLVDKRAVDNRTEAVPPPDPRSFVLEVQPGQWVRLAPRAPAGPVP